MGSVSLQSLKTVTSNKYQASEEVVWGGEENSVKMNRKVQSPLETRGKEKERKKKEVGGGGLFYWVKYER